MAAAPSSLKGIHFESTGPLDSTECVNREDLASAQIGPPKISGCLKL